MAQPYAYLRKSRVTSDRHVSWEVQEAAVREMAGGDLVILSDWNKSGRKGASGRPGYRQLLAAIEAGQVSTLYSYSLSRLSRSLADFTRLVELCQQHGVPIRLYSERHLDFDSASGRLMVNILSAFAQMEAELAQERARDTIAVRRARGDRIGGQPFRDTDAVLEAYREAGSMSGAAKLLTIRGVPTRQGNRVWQPTSVLKILQRVAPEELPVTRRRGAKASAPFRFYALLLCRCGRLLTGERDSRRKKYVTYRCVSGRADPDHGPRSVPESIILPWAKEEASHMGPPDDIVQLAEDAEDKKKTLRERMDRLRRVYVDGLLEEPAYQEELAAIQAELAEADAAGRLLTIPPVNWEGGVEEINEALRALWKYVPMDERQRPPEKAEWWFEHWRRA